MLEKLALLKMALWRAPVVRSASACRTSGEVGRLVRLVVSMLSLKTRDRDRARTPRPGFRAVLASRTKQYQAAWWYRARPGRHARLGRALGGDVEVESTLGQGSLFRVRLPRDTTPGP